MLREGRSNCFYRVNITDDTENTVAVVNISGAHLDIKPDNPGKI